MKNIKLLRRTHVTKVGVCEAKSKTPCDDETAAYLVEQGYAQYADKESLEAAKKEAAAAAKKEAG